MENMDLKELISASAATNIPKNHMELDNMMDSFKEENMMYYRDEFETDYSDSLDLDW